MKQSFHDGFIKIGHVSNFIQFTYSYKFSKGKNVKKLNRQVQVESDSKSQTIGR